MINRGRQSRGKFRDDDSVKRVMDMYSNGLSEQYRSLLCIICLNLQIAIMTQFEIGLRELLKLCTARNGRTLQIERAQPT